MVPGVHVPGLCPHAAVVGPPFGSSPVVRSHGSEGSKRGGGVDVGRPTNHQERLFPAPIPDIPQTRAYRVLVQVSQPLCGIQLHGWDEEGAQPSPNSRGPQRPAVFARPGVLGVLPVLALRPSSVERLYRLFGGMLPAQGSG